MGENHGSDKGQAAAKLRTQRETAPPMTGRDVANPTSVTPSNHACKVDPHFLWLE